MKISLIVTCHPGTEKYFEECLESINAQTEKPHEIIVIVDGYDKPMIYPGTTTIIREKNIGVAYSRDQGVKIMTGDYILFVDADDVLPENYIREMKGAVRFKKADIAYPSCLIWSKWGDEQPLENDYFDPISHLTINDMLYMNNVLISSLMKKEVYKVVGGFDPDLPLFEDWMFFLEAMIIGYRFVHANTFLKYRQRTQSRNHVNDEHRIRITEKIRNMIFARYPQLKAKYSQYIKTPLAKGRK